MNVYMFHGVQAKIKGVNYVVFHVFQQKPRQMILNLSIKGLI